jgi:protoporphyrinogen oxidase
VLEAENSAGGLARSFRDPQGFTWDIGGHVQFSHYELFDNAMEQFLGSDGWLVHERESWVWMRNRFIPYPLQNNIHRLPPDDLNKCLQGLVEITRKPRPKPRDFAGWIDATFGPGLAEVFMRPYNMKVWAFPPELMNAGWVGERVAVTDLARVLHNLVYNHDELSWGPNNRFQFPRKGGTGAIWNACADRLPSERLKFSVRVTGVDLRERRLTTDSGTQIAYDALISTMPLSELIKLSSRQDLLSYAEKGIVVL